MQVSYKQFLSKDQCKYFIGQAHLKGFEEAGIKTYNNTYELIHKVRRSLVATLPTNQKVNSIFKPLLKEYGVKKLPKDFQIIKYRRGDFFKKHTDSGNGANKRYKTLIIQLSNSNEYKGASVDIFHENIKSTLDTEAGRGVLFDSSLIHEVKELTDGVRYALVMWFKYEDFNSKSVV